MADRLGQISASQFVGNAPIVVEPRAVHALTEAFRSGQIRADEIAERAMLQPAKKAAAEMAADPLVVEAKKKELIAAGRQAELQTKALEQTASIPTQVREMNTELSKAQWQVRPTTNLWTGEDSKEVVRRWSTLEQWKTQQAKVAAELSLLKEGGQEIVTPRGTELVPVTKGSLQVKDPQRIAQAQQFLATYPSPQTYDAAGKPQAPSIFDAAPGTVSTVSPVSGSGLNPGPGVALTPEVQPAPVAAGQTLPVTTSGLVIKPVDIKTKAPTEMQAKAGTAVARMMSADEVLQNLQSKGFNPSATQNWLQDYLVGPFVALQTADKKTYDTAAGSWIQGLLRLESGAAIAAKEQKWYENTFFPRPGDSPEVQQIKVGMRSDVEKIVNELASGGGLNVGDLINVRKQGEILNAKPTGAAALEQTTINGKTYNVDRSSGRPRLIPVTGNAPVVQPYRQPDKLSGNVPVKVEKKKAPDSAKALRGF